LKKCIYDLRTLCSPKCRDRARRCGDFYDKEQSFLTPPKLQVKSV
jgi:hypothetical protein